MVGKREGESRGDEHKGGGEEERKGGTRNMNNVFCTTVS